MKASRESKRRVLASSDSLLVPPVRPSREDLDLSSTLTRGRRSWGEKVDGHEFGV
jgi:hypothetical protein